MGGLMLPNVVRRIAVGMMLLAVAAPSLQASPVDVMIGSRGFGLGGAYVAIAEDPSAGYWNPAGLSFLKDISIMESNWIFQDVTNLNVNYLAADVPVPKVGVFGAGWLLTSTKLEEGWDTASNGAASTNNATEGTVSLSYGRRIVEEFSIFKQPSFGVTVNQFSYSVSGTAGYGGNGVGLDLGLATHLPYGLSAGFMWRNVAAEIKDERVDPELRFGLGYTGIFGRISAR